MKKKLMWLGIITGLGLIVWQRKQRTPKTVRGKIVIITGASSGIGRATAHAFAREGASVVLVARREQRLLTVQEELADYDAPTLVVPTDVTDDADTEALIKAVLAQFGRIDVLVNIAGIATGGPLTGISAARLRAMTDVNVYAPIHLTQRVLPTMLSQGSGHIVNIASIAGLIAAPGIAAYAATRTSMISFSEALERELAGTGVHVSAVLPGWTRTAMLHEMAAPTMREAGILNPPWITLDPPEAPAQAIVDAVRYNRRTIVLGGFLFRLRGFVARIVSAIVGAFIRNMIDLPKTLETTRELGT